MTTRREVRGVVERVARALQRALSGETCPEAVKLAASLGDANAMIEVEADRLVAQENFGSLGPMEAGYTVVLERKPEP